MSKEIGTTPTVSPWKDLAEGIKQVRRNAAELLRKHPTTGGYQATDFDTTPIKLIYGRTAEQGELYLGIMAAYADVKKWTEDKSRKEAFALLGVVEVYTEVLQFETY